MLRPIMPLFQVDLYETRENTYISPLRHLTQLLTMRNGTCKISSLKLKENKDTSLREGFVKDEQKLAWLCHDQCVRIRFFKNVYISL